MTTRATRSIATLLAALIATSGLAITPSLAAGPRACDAYARRVANHRANEGNVVAGAVVGAGVGAILGAALGNGRAGSVAVGAVMGGAGGTIIAGSANQGKWRRVYNAAYRDCRRNM